MLFFVFIALQLGQLYTVTSEPFSMRAALFDSALKGIPIQFLRHTAPRGGHFLGMCFMETTSYHEFREYEDDFSAEEECTLHLTNTKCPLMRALKKKVMMRILQNTGPVIIAHNVLLAGDCTLYKGFRNKGKHLR